MDLPGSARRLVDVVGYGDAARIIEAIGGTRLWVPQRASIHADHPLVRLVGVESALKLADAFGGLAHFDVPRCLGELLRERNRKIMVDIAAGDSHRTIALRYRLTERHVLNIKKRHHSTPLARNIDLFATESLPPDQSVNQVPS